MKKRVMSLLIMLCMLITMMPTTFMADEVTGKITCVDQTEKVVDGVDITIRLWNYSPEGDEYVEIAHSTNGIIEYDVEMNETNDRFIYNDKEYEEIEVSYVLPEGCEDVHGETESAYWQYADVWFEEPIYNLNVIDVQKDLETPMENKTVTCEVISEKGEIVDGANIKIFLCNSMGDENDRTVIAESSNGTIEFTVEYKNNRFWYEEEIYAYIGYGYTLPEGFQSTDGIMGGESFTEPIYVGDVTWFVEDMSDGDSRVEETPGSQYTYETVVENDSYYIEKTYFEDILKKTSIVFNDEKDYNEKELLEALSYVTKDDLVYVYLNTTEEQFPTISSAVMKEMAAKEVGFQINKNDTLDAIYVEKVISTDAFGIEIKTNNNEVIIKKLTDAGVSGGYIQYEIVGTNFEEKFSLNQGISETGIFTIEDENANNGYFENKYLYYYDVARDLFVSGEEIGTVMYFENEWVSPVIGLVCYQSGNYIVSDKPLPENLTNEKINIEITTDTTIKKDVLEDAKENGASMNVQVEASEKSSFVNWLFGNIDNVVDFIPTVHVDATIDEIDKKVKNISVTADFKYTTVSFDFAGVLPGKAEVTLDVANSNLGKEDVKDGQKVYLYYYDPTTKNFELVDSSVIRSGFATFSMTHCSDYIITIEELPNVVKDTTPGTEKNTVPKTGDNTMVFGYVLFMLVGMSIIVTSVSAKKKER